jgi:phage terminase small subunit
VQVSPWITIANKQVELMTRLMGELGLSPSSRSRLAVDVQSGPDLSECGL